MKKIGRIILGWWLLLFPSKQSKEIKEMAKKRLAVCKCCCYRDGRVCSVCGCFLKAKAVLSDEDCPRGKWPYWWKV
jgi:hypothetical protein